MNPPDNSIKVRYPAKPDLVPASVVAVRPGEAGDRVDKGAYVLSVETPSGSRNIVSPADG